jgi:hypothetical protein
MNLCSMLKVCASAGKPIRISHGVEVSAVQARRAMKKMFSS